MSRQQQINENGQNNFISYEKEKKVQDKFNKQNKQIDCNKSDQIAESEGDAYYSEQMPYEKKLKNYQNQQVSSMTNEKEIEKYQNDIDQFKKFQQQQKQKYSQGQQGEESYGDVLQQNKRKSADKYQNDVDRFKQLKNDNKNIQNLDQFAHKRNENKQYDKKNDVWNEENYQKVQNTDNTYHELQQPQTELHQKKQSQKQNYSDVHRHNERSDYSKYY